MILWLELIDVQSEISREHYKEILDILDENFITEKLNKHSISLTTFKSYSKTTNIHFQVKLISKL